MSEINLPYLHIYKDVRGKDRCYFNRRGWPKVPLPMPHEDDFLEKYKEAKAAPKLAPKDSKAKIRIKKHTFAYLIQSYKQSYEYKVLDEETLAVYNRFLKNLENSFGHLPSQLTLQQVNEIRKVKKDAPTQANRLVSIIRIIYKNAILEGLAKYNPTIGLENYSVKSKGHKTWTEEEINQFIEYWPLGTRQHLALQAILQTSQRRKDIVNLSFEMIRNDRLEITQSKTGTPISVPVLPGLQQALDLLDYCSGPILRTSFNKPYSPAGFGNWFRDAVREAGLHGISAHGLRKAMCVRLANVGCSPHEIMAISGHLTLSEVERYTREANMKRLAKTATDKLLNE